MKRLRNLKMLILSMAITGIFGFANVFAMEKYPNKINTEQDNRRSLNNKKKLLAKLENLKKWRDVIVEKLEPDEEKRKYILNQIDTCIKDFEFVIESLGDEGFDDVFYKKKVKLYNNVKNIVESYLGNKEKFLNNKNDLLKKFENLKKWRDMVDQGKQNTNDETDFLVKRYLLEGIDLCIANLKMCFESWVDEDYGDDNIYNGQVSLYNNFKNNIEDYLEIKLEESVLNNNLNYNYNQNLAMKKNKNPMEKFVKIKNRLFQKFKDLEKWRDMVGQRKQKTNIEKDLLKQIDDCKEWFDVCLRSFKDEEYDDGLYNQLNNAYKNVKKDVDNYLGNINEKEISSRKINSNKIDKKDKKDKKNVSKNINFNKGNKEGTIQRENINDNQDEIEKNIEFMKKDLKDRLDRLCNWKDCILNKKIVLKDENKREILRKLEAEIKDFETTLPTLDFYKIKIIKLFYDNLLQDFLEIEKDLGQVWKLV